MALVFLRATGLLGLRPGSKNPNSQPRSRAWNLSICIWVIHTPRVQVPDNHILPQTLSTMIYTKTPGTQVLGTWTLARPPIFGRPQMTGQASNVVGLSKPTAMQPNGLEFRDLELRILELGFRDLFALVVQPDEVRLFLVLEPLCPGLGCNLPPCWDYSVLKNPSQNPRPHIPL